MILVALGLILTASMAIGQSAQWLNPAGDAPLSAQEAFVLHSEVRSDGGLRLTWQIAEGYYLYRDALAVTTAAGPVALDLPVAEVTQDLTFGLTHIYRNEITVDLPPQHGLLTVAWQGCKEGSICYPPQRTEIDLGSASAGLSLSTEPSLMDRLGARGAPVLLLAFFGFGVALAFTPCVLPMVPILGGFLARGASGLTRLRGFTLSSAYVVAMAGAFGLLGLAAAATGQNLQIALQSPLAIGVLTALFTAFALSMFGLFEISLPRAWVGRLQGAGPLPRGTIGGAMGLGFTSALVVGPCVTVPLAAALLYIAQTGDMALGSAALFMLGLGKGAPLVVFGTLGGRYLPRSGPWMVRVKQGFGFVFLGLALWLAARLWPGPWIVAGWGALLAALGIFLLRSVLPSVRTKTARGAVRMFATIALVPALVLGMTASRGAHDPLRPFDFTSPDMTDPLPWTTVRGQTAFAGALAAAEGPTIIYLSADWCIICRSIDRRVLPHAGVVDALAPMTRIKLDLSDFDLDGQALLALLGAAGPPTMIFLDATLHEAEGTRLVGDTRPAQVIAAARKAQK